jgi:hypothetical protein
MIWDDRRTARVELAADPARPGMVVLGLKAMSATSPTSRIYDVGGFVT